MIMKMTMQYKELNLQLKTLIMQMREMNRFKNSPRQDQKEW